MFRINAATARQTARWQPAASVRVSIIVHTATVAALAINMSWWPWAIGFLVANHLILFVAVLFPRSGLLGPNVVRLPAAAARCGEVCLTFDDGPDAEITPRLLDILDQYNAKASFFCIGERAAALPDLTREIVRRGHSIENHTHRHPYCFSFYGISRLRREVETAQRAIVALTGQIPVFFRAPAGFRNVLLDPVLVRLGLRYVSWTRRGRDGTSRNAALVLARLTRDLAPGDILLLHDGRQRATLAEESVVLVVLPALLKRLRVHGFSSVTLPVAFSHAPCG